MKRVGKPMTADEALTAMAALCSRGEQCEADLRKAMRRHGLNDADADTVIARLRQERFIDDERYVRAFVHDRIAYNGWGVRKVRQQLRLKHFDTAFVDDIINDALDRQAYRLSLTALLQRRWRETDGRDTRRRREAVIRTAMSRGYEPGLIFELVNELFGNTGDDSEDCDYEFAGDDTAMD